MSIVIQGIDIPKRHYVEGFYIDEDGNILDISRKRIIGKATKLPSHGRLIDADYLKEHLYQCEVNGMPLHRMFTEIDELFDAIDDIPTVIESEAEE